MEIIVTKEDKIKEERGKLLNSLKKLNGKTIKEVDFSNLLSNPNNKGAIGQIIQKYLGKNLDNDKGMDFPEAELELKVTGLISYKDKNKGAYHAKERLVLSEINYNEDYKESFEESHVIKKCNDLLMTCYEYIKPKKGEKANYGSFPIIDSFIMSLSDIDIKILKNDYDFIMNKIKKGMADEISQSDTEYLSTCTKSSNSLVRTTQPFSSKSAKPRAFAFKDSFLTVLIKKYISNETYQSIVDNAAKYDKFDLEKYVLSKLSPYFGKTEYELEYNLNIETNAKHKYSMIINKIFKVSDLQESEEFKKANITVKTLRIQKGGTIKEKMSFPKMNFIEVANTPWEESKEREYFANKKFLFIVFEETGRGYILKNALFYNFKEEFIDEFIRPTYNRTQETLLSGNIVKGYKYKEIKGEIKKLHSTHFVGIFENPICHVRPHGRNFNDQAQLPVKDNFTGYTSYEKQCFWIDTRYIKSLIEDKELEYINFTRKKIKERMTIPKCDIEEEMEEE